MVGPHVNLIVPTRFMCGPFFPRAEKDNVNFGPLRSHETHVNHS